MAITRPSVGAVPGRRESHLARAGALSDSPGGSYRHVVAFGLDAIGEVVQAQPLELVSGQAFDVASGDGKPGALAVVDALHVIGVAALRYPGHHGCHINTHTVKTSIRLISCPSPPCLGPGPSASALPSSGWRSLRRPGSRGSSRDRPWAWPGTWPASGPS